MEVRPSSSAERRLVVGIDEPRPGGPAGLEPDGDRPAGRRPAREVDDGAQLAHRLEEIDGDLGIAVQPADLEAAFARLAVIAARPGPPGPSARIQDDPAEE